MPATVDIRLLASLFQEAAQALQLRLTVPPLAASVIAEDLTAEIEKSDTLRNPRDSDRVVRGRTDRLAVCL